MTSDQIYKVSGFADTQPMPGLASDAESNRRVTVLLKVENLDESETPGDTNVVSTVDTSQNPP